MAKKLLSGIILMMALILVLASCGHEHEWGNWIVQTPATVLTDGLQYRNCACGEKETQSIPKIGAEKVLSGRWVYQGNNTLVYLFLDFNGNSVRYGMNMGGQDLDGATWTYTYKIDGTTLILTREKGGDLNFTIKDMGNSLRIFNEEGNEFLHVD